MTDAMRPLPTNGPVTPGTLVWGADFNAAVTMLYRWWGLIDAPSDVRTVHFADAMFADNVVVESPDLGTIDRMALASAIHDHRASGDSAHHLGYDDYRLFWIDGEHFRLEARFTFYRSALSERRKLAAILLKQPDNRFTIRSIREETDAALPAAAFVPSYIVNRARATSTQFQAHMDSLSGDATGLRGLMMPVMELHGLVASKADQSSSGSDMLTDVDDLRQSIAGTDHVADNAIRDFSAFSDWFAAAPALFSYGLHKLEIFTVTPKPDRRFEIVAQYDWRAETLNGAQIETHHPLTWVFVDTDEAFMRIEKLLPF